MRKVLPIACLALFVLNACASQRQAGETMVVAGAVTTAIAAQNASHSYCTQFGCTAARTPSRSATQLALAGAAVAAGGYALMATAPRGDQKARTPPPSDPTNAWRLQRKTPIAPDPEPAPENDPAEGAAPASDPSEPPAATQGTPQR
ncbi:MAG: hypothetical protein ABW133_04515 [Polyangiaceae bacterium]